MGAGIGALAAVRNRYQHDLRRDYERMLAFEPSVLETPCGLVEYAEAGDGSPLLVVHGVFGAYDFGVGTGRAIYRTAIGSFRRRGSVISARRFRPIPHRPLRLMRSRYSSII